MLKLPIITTHWPITKGRKFTLAPNQKLLTNQPSDLNLLGCSEFLHKRNFAPSSNHDVRKSHIANQSRNIGLAKKGGSDEN